MGKDAGNTGSHGAGPVPIVGDRDRAGANPQSPETGAPVRGAVDRLEAGPDAARQRIVRVVLAGGVGRRAAPVERDVEQAVRDLEADSLFQPRGLRGPFELHLQLDRGRLVFDIRDAAGAPLAVLGLALGPFRRLIKDYVLLVDSHGSAMAGGRASRAEAIDMGRRGLHNEGAELVAARLEGKIAVGFETARRLFTLVCVLHQRF